MSIKLFISHASSDDPIKKGVTDLLEKCFKDVGKEILCTSIEKFGLATGKEIIKTIRKSLNETTVVLVLLTRKAIRSSWVITEMGMAWGLNKEVLPVMFGISVKDLPGPYPNIQAADALSFDNWKTIIATIHSKTKWKKRDGAIVDRSICNFVEALDSFPKEIDPRDVELLDAIQIYRDRENEVPIRILEGPVQSTDNVTRLGDEHYMPVKYAELCTLFPSCTEKAGMYHIPYELVYKWKLPKTIETARKDKHAHVVCHPKDFELKSISVSHKLFQVQAFTQFVRIKRMREDSPVIRLEGFSKKKPPTLYIRKAQYSDQVQSNLVITWKGNKPDWTGATALQRPLSKDLHLYGGTPYEDLHHLVFRANNEKLPPLDCPYLANSLGVAVILFYKKEEGSEWIPILSDRAKKSGEKAVFQKGLSCTASGVLEFRIKSDDKVQSSYKAKTLRDLVEPWLIDKIREETFIEKQEIELLLPLGLCREFQRGGKPQLFYAGAINLSMSQLEKRLASKPSEGKLHFSKIEDVEQILQFPERRDKFTPEFIANWYLAGRSKFTTWLKAHTAELKEQSRKVLSE